MRATVALTTDFGVGSAYVAEVKGVLLSTVPELRIIDICHNLPPYDIGAAEVFLRRTAWSLPQGTVHLVVVDPGVGGARRGVAVYSRGVAFVGPDNGVLALPTLAGGSATRVVQLDNVALHRTPTSSVFHGRDVFAPVAAELAAGLELESVGSPIPSATLVPSTLPQAAEAHGYLVGAALGADRFGNMTTNLAADQINPTDPDVAVRSATQAAWRSLTFCRTYNEADDDQPIALLGSDGYLEIACHRSSAQTFFVLNKCSTLRVRARGRTHGG